MASWDYAHCLPYFKRMETCLAGADDWRGGDGPLVLERGPGDEPAVRRLLRGRAAGRLPADPRRQRYQQEGFSRFDRTIKNGRRWSAADAYLRPAPGRKNLTVQCLSLVHRVIFEGRGRSASSTPARCRSAAARPDRHRPRRSGRRGDPLRRRDQHPATAAAVRHRHAGELAALDIPVIADLPGVGENLQDHLEAYVQYASKQPVSLAPALKLRNRPDRAASGCCAGPAGADQPLRGRRLHPRNDGRRLPEPDVPLPADRRPLRRHQPDPGPRLPGAHRARCTPTPAAA
jgi:choline dehydrogenase